MHGPMNVKISLTEFIFIHLVAEGTIFAEKVVFSAINYPFLFLFSNFRVNVFFYR